MWLCAKIVAETDLYEADKEEKNLIGWVRLSERVKELCKERNNLYEKQNDLKGQKWAIESKNDIIKTSMLFKKEGRYKRSGLIVGGVQS